MKLFKFMLRERKEMVAGIVLLLIFITIGWPTNVGGHWHLETPWDGGPLWGKFLAGIIIAYVVVGLIYIAWQEKSRSGK